MPSENNSLTVPAFTSKLPAEFIEGLDERGKYLYQTIDKITQVQDFLLNRAVADANTLSEVKEQTIRTNGRTTANEKAIKDLELVSSASVKAAEVARIAAMDAAEVARTARVAAQEVIDVAKDARKIAAQAVENSQKEKPIFEKINFFIKLLKNKWFWIGLLAFFTFVVPWLGAHSKAILEFLKALVIG